MKNKLSPAFFQCHGDHYIPNDIAASAWNTNQISGTAVCALLAHELETHQPEREFVPARFTAELFSPVLNSEMQLRSQTVRDSNRIRVATAEIIQNNDVRSRGTAQFLRNGVPPDGKTWEPKRDYSTPVENLNAPDGSLPLFKFGDGEWTSDFNSGANTLRKSAWVNVPPLIDGEPITPFERAAFIADLSNLLGSWGTAGIGYINTDVTLTLTRLPCSNEIGMQASDRIASDGISVCTTLVYDRRGPLGTCQVTCLSNARQQVDVAAAYEETDAVQQFNY